MAMFIKSEKGFICKYCKALTGAPEQHKCDGIRKAKLLALVKAATDNIRDLSYNVSRQSQEYYLREAEEIMCGATTLLEEPWDSQKTEEDHPLRNGFGG